MKTKMLLTSILSLIIIFGILAGGIVKADEYFATITKAPNFDINNDGWIEAY